jgi:hypothetical protein
MIANLSSDKMMLVLLITLGKKVTFFFGICNFVCFSLSSLLFICWYFLLISLSSLSFIDYSMRCHIFPKYWIFPDVHGIVECLYAAS